MVWLLKAIKEPTRDMLLYSTFKLELVLLDATNICSKSVNSVLHILKDKNLNPDNLAKKNEGASILLVWIINMVKFNIGATRYGYNKSGTKKLLIED